MTRRGIAIGSAMLAVLGFVGAPPAMGMQGTRSPSVLTVEWPTQPLTWNTQWYLTVHVRPAEAGRVVRLAIYGQGGPGWSTIDTRRTDSSGTARLALFTLCPDMPCSAMTDRYRVTLAPSATRAGASVQGRVRLTP